MANQIEKLDEVGGIFTKGWNATARALGQEGDEIAIRDRFERLRAKGVISNMPKGLAPMSNTDLELIQKGWPAANADPKYIAGFARAYAKMQELDGLLMKSSSAWENAFATLPNAANRDINLHGVMVPKGTTVDEYQKAFVAANMPSEGTAAPASTGGKRPYDRKW